MYKVQEGHGADSAPIQRRSGAESEPVAAVTMTALAAVVNRHAAYALSAAGRSFAADRRSRGPSRRSCRRQVVAFRPAVALQSKPLVSSAAQCRQGGFQPRAAGPIRQTRAAAFVPPYSLEPIGQRPPGQDADVIGALEHAIGPRQYQRVAACQSLPAMPRPKLLGIAAYPEMLGNPLTTPALSPKVEHGLFLGCQHDGRPYQGGRRCPPRRMENATGRDSPAPDCRGRSLRYSCAELLGQSKVSMGALESAKPVKALLPRVGVGVGRRIGRFHRVQRGKQHVPLAVLVLMRGLECFEPVGNGNSRSFGLESHPERGGFHEYANDDASARTRRQPFLRGIWSIRCPSRTCATSTASSPTKSTPGRKSCSTTPDGHFHPAANRAASKVSAQEEKIARLENKLQQKNEVISELMEENVRAKKANGEL